MGATYRQVNARAWSSLAQAGEESTIPYGPAEFAHARYWLDPQRWLPWDAIRTVLCLASGGGQQGPLFASLGLEVTVLDLSPAQLATDRRTAAAYGLPLETIVGDMLDLSALHGRGF